MTMHATAHSPSPLAISSDCNIRKTINMKRILSLVLTFSAFIAVSAQTAGPLKVTEKKLSNGMTVWLNEDHSQPKVFGCSSCEKQVRKTVPTRHSPLFRAFSSKALIKSAPWITKRRSLGSTPYPRNTTCWQRQPTKRAALTIQRNINRLSQEAGKYAIPNEFENLISTYGGTGLNAYTSFDETVFHNSFAPQYIAQWCELNSERLINPVFRLFQGELETVYEEKTCIPTIC